LFSDNKEIFQNQLLKGYSEQCNTCSIEETGDFFE
jgi:hypothetical protein